MVGEQLGVRFVHHVSFRVDDLEEALGFYEKLLGCERLPRPELAFRGAWLRIGDVEVHVIESQADETTGSPATAPTPMANHVAFAVDDLDAFRERLEANGITVGTGVPQLRQLIVQDPSGNVIEFAEARR